MAFGQTRLKKSEIQEIRQLALLLIAFALWTFELWDYGTSAPLLFLS